MIDVIFLLLFFMSGMLNAIMDTLQFHFGSSIFSKPPFGSGFWDPKTSWKNKYKERGDTWMVNLIEKLDDGPFVFLTDGWHFMQMFWRVTLFSATLMARYTTNIEVTGIFILDLIISFSIISTVYLGAFVIFFNSLLKKKKK